MHLVYSLNLPSHWVVWWLNFMCQFDWPRDAQIKQYFPVCLWECFWMRWAFESVGLSRYPSPAWVGLIQSLEGLSRTKCGRRRKWFFFLFHWLNWDISYYVLLPLRHGIYIMGSPASQAFTLGLELSLTNGFTGPSTCRWQSVGLLSLCHCICQFLIVHLHSCLSVHLYTDICLSFDSHISILLVLFSEEPWLNAAAAV